MDRAVVAESLRALAVAGALGLSVHVPRAESVAIRQLVEVVDFGAAAMSPDGRLVAFRTEQASVERNTYDTVWYVQPIDGSAPPRRLGDGGAPLRDTGGLSERAAAVWSPDGRWIFYRAVVDGRVDVWRAAVDGSRTEPVTRDPANVRAFSLSADGAVLKYSVGATREAVVAAEQDEYDRGVHIDRTVPLGDTLFRAGDHEGRLATQRLVDNELERFPLLTSSPDRWKAIDLSTGAGSESVADDVAAGPSSLSDPAMPPAEVWKRAEDRGSGRIAVLARTGAAEGAGRRPEIVLAMLPGRNARRPVRCAAEACLGKPITDVVWRPGSDEIVFTVTDPDAGLAQSLFRWNVADGTVTPVARSSGQIGGGGRWEPGPCAASFDALVCVAAEADRPPRLERIDLASGQRRILFAPNAALAHDLAGSVAVRPLHWTDTRGTRFTGQYYPAVAAGGGPAPLFVVYYRCAGFLRGGVGDEWPLATLARHGIAALCINAAPFRADAVERFEQGRSAVESAVDLLASRGDVDRDRVGIGGLSMGAEVALWTALHGQDIRAVSMSTPVISPPFHLLMSPWQDVFLSRLARFWQLGAPEETPARWRQIAPPPDPARLRAPILMQLAEQEYRYALDYAVPWMLADRADVYAFPHEAHQKFQPRHKLAVYERNLDWFRFWLQEAEDGHPAKAAQYVRWRAMRERFPAAGTP